eukprot:1094976-Prorocentrum_minimum.AAC.1
MSVHIRLYPVISGLCLVYLCLSSFAAGATYRHRRIHRGEATPEPHANRVNARGEARRGHARHNLRVRESRRLERHFPHADHDGAVGHAGELQPVEAERGGFRKALGEERRDGGPVEARARLVGGGQFGGHEG